MLSRIIIVTICLLVGAGTTVAQVQPAPAAKPQAESKELQFAFENTPWRDVIQYLADEAEMALHVRDLPTGSFTYADPNKFTLDEAIDRVNLFLLSQGFTLVRRGNLLSVINLGDPRGIQQLEALAKLVTVEQLKELNQHEVVKCIFPLEDIDPEDAVEELAPLKLMTTPSVFNKTNRLMITDTVVKLRSVQAILDAFEPSALDNGLVMKNFALQHVDAEDILSVARPHLGLATGEMIGIDVSLSADLKGKNIFVTGVDDKVKLIEGLINSLDKADDALSTADGKAELKSHLVRGGNVETVYNVLQTLLSGKSARLSIDEAASSVVALASPEIQNEIAQTVAQLEASDADFEVIPLRNVDPYFAISLLEEMLDLPDPYLIDSTEEGSGQPKVSAPKIDADPGNMRLFVRGKKHQIEQIKKIVAELDVNSSVGESDETRVLPLRGRQAERILLTAAKFWREANPIILYPSVQAESQPSERVLATGDDSPKSTPPPPASKPSVPRYLTDDPASKAPALHCQITSRGLLIQCEDVEALKKFESHLRTIAGPLGATPSPPVVFYLKYARPDDAIRMLAEMLDGGEAAKEAEVGSLVNGYVGGAGSFLGSLVSSRQGMTTMTAGTITVVADSRLNRLIAQGTTSDIELIERYLKIVDKDRSITAVETYGTSQVIELKHAKAMEVAEAIREAYASRVAKAPAAGGARSGQPQQRPGQPQQEAPQQLKVPAPNTAELASKGGGEKRPGGANANAAGQRPGGAAATRDLEPKMTVAVHEASNSLIITAPEQLFKEVEALAMKLDQRNERVVEIIQPPNVIVFDALMQALSDEANGDRPSNNRGTNRAAPGNAPSTRAGTTPARNSNGRRPTEFQFQKPTER